MSERSLFQIGIVFGLLLVSVTFGAAHGAEVKNLMGRTPTSDQLIDALSAPPNSTASAKSRSSSNGPVGLLFRNIRIEESPKEQIAGRVGVMLDIRFEFNSASITFEAMRVLDNLGMALTSPKLKESHFLAIGHTDSVGSATYNQRLSERRAAAVRDYLTRKFFISFDRLGALGAGESMPRDVAHPESGVNRRVEIYNIE